MNRRSGDRLYTAILMAFLVGLVGLGLLGIPALLVAAIGIAVATLVIAVLGKRSPIPPHYVPSVLEGSSMRRRRGLHLRRRHQASPPLRFR